MRKLLAPAPDLVPASRAPASGVRGAIDSIVQSSLVELFTVHGVAVAPLPRIAVERAPSVPEISAAIGFTFRGGTTPGKMTLSLPSLVLELMKGGVGSASKSDWARELANQLIGRIKNRLLQFSVRIEAGVPFSADAAMVARQLRPASGTRVYAGRTLRGELLVTLEGMPHESQLNYLGPVNVASEGDLILF